MPTLVLRTYVRDQDPTDHETYNVTPFPESKELPRYLNAVFAKMNRSERRMVDELKERFKYQRKLYSAHYYEVIQALNVAARSESFDTCLAIAYVVDSLFLTNRHAAPFRKALHDPRFLRLVNKPPIFWMVVDEMMQSKRLSADDQLYAEMLNNKEYLQGVCSLSFLIIFLLPILIAIIFNVHLPPTFLTKWSVSTMIVDGIVCFAVYKWRERKRRAEIWAERVDKEAVYERLLPDA